MPYVFFSLLNPVLFIVSTSKKTLHVVSRLVFPLIISLDKTVFFASNKARKTYKFVYAFSVS